MLQILQRKQPRSNKWVNLTEKRDIIKNLNLGGDLRSVSFVRRGKNLIIKTLIGLINISTKQARLPLEKLTVTAPNIKEDWQGRLKEQGF